MDDLLENLKEEWKSDGSNQDKSQTSPKDIITLSKGKMKSSRVMHFWNIGILLITLVGISSFFYFIAQFKDVLSLVGVALMVGGLVVRILIEAFSIYKASKIDMSEPAAIVNEQFVAFHQHRKRIHGIVTTSILLGYTVGFGLLLPEFSKYLSQLSILLITLSYIVGATIVGFSIRSGIRKEMKQLNGLLEIRAEIRE